MIGRFKYEILVKYPHMRPRDIAIWENFITKNPDFFQSVDYDVLVGSGAPFGTTLNNLEGQDFGAIYKLKIDVVGYRAGEIWVIEVGPNKEVGGLAKVAAYDELYRETYKPNLPVYAALLTDRVTPDMEYLAKSWDLRLLTA